MSKRTSTLWTVVEEDGKDLAFYIKALNEAYGKEYQYTEENEDYQYLLRSLKHKDDFWFGQIVKYSKNKNVPSINLETRELGEEAISNYPLVDFAYFGVNKNGLVIEEKRPHLGQRQMLRILNALYLRFGDETRVYNLDFKLSKNLFEQYIKRIELLKLVRFSNIRLNPNNPNENVQRFEDIVRDSKTKAIEFKNPRSGLDKNSAYIDGGRRLTELKKADAHFEGTNVEDNPEVFDTKEAMAKEREKVEYEREDREETILEKVFSILRTLLR